MFDNPFSFEGRIRRTEYLLSLLISVLILFLLISHTIELSPLSMNDDEITYIIIFHILNLWLVASAGAKRSHDLGNDGWWQVSAKNLLQLLIQEGQPGENSYGVNPKDLNKVNHFVSKTTLPNHSELKSKNSFHTTHKGKHDNKNHNNGNSTIDNFWDQINFSNFYKLTKNIFKYLTTSPSERRFERKKKLRELEIAKDPTKHPYYLEIEKFNEQTGQLETYWTTVLGAEDDDLILKK